jgi:hypothetical protein
MEHPSPIEQKRKPKALVIVAASALLLSWIVFAIGAYRPDHETGGDEFARGMILMFSMGISLFANLICLIGLLVGPLRLAFFLGMVLSPSALYLWVAFFGGHGAAIPVDERA